MIVAGIGCCKGASAAAIDAVIDAALRRAGLAQSALYLIATSVAKAGEAGIAAAAASRGVALHVVAQAELEAAGGRAVTTSARVVAVAGVPSVAEAAALAGAGDRARLLLPRIVHGPATCALAIVE